MKVALTGATGRVGSRLAPRLSARGHEVTCLIRSPAVVVAGPHRAVSGDLNDARAVAPFVAGADAVVHAAAIFRGASEDDIRRTNVDGSVALAEAALTADVPRFVFISTTLVHADGPQRPTVEDDPVDAGPGARTYPRSKALAESALAQILGARLTVLRLSFVYGDGDPHLREAIALFSRSASHQRLQMVHHADVAQAVIRVLAMSSSRGRVYNIGDDAPTTLHEVRQLAGLSMDKDGADAAAVEFAPWRGVVSTCRARSELGYRPLFPTAWSAYDAGSL